MLDSPIVTLPDFDQLTGIVVRGTELVSSPCRCHCP